MPLLLDPVEQVIANLKSEKEVSQETLRKCQSAFRTMRIHNRPGCFGRHDHDLTRAAALLEYVIRETEGRKIPLKNLAQASFLKLVNFQKLHQLVGNFLVNTSAQKRSEETYSLQNSASNGAGSGKDRHKLLPSSIPSLAIKFGPYVRDPTGFASKAQDLFSQIERHAKGMNASASRQQLYDLQRYQRAYEAACFYIVATKEKKPNKASSYDQDGEEKSLDLATLLEASTEFTELQFRHVYKYIEGLLEVFKEKKAAKKTQAASKKRTSEEAAKATKGKKRQRTSGVTAEDKLPAASVETALSILDQIDQAQDLNDATEHSSRENAIIRAVFSPSFLDWKEQILSKSKKASRETLHKECGTPLDDISDSQALAHAADAALLQFGLLQ
jgi:hypothetical protein